MSVTRKERLTTRLKDAVGKLDGAMFINEPERMRTQQLVAGLRAKVLTIRAELCAIAMEDILKPGGETWEAWRQDRDALLVRVEKAELAARAASKQAAEDEVPEIIARLDAVDERAQQAGLLH